MQPRLVVLFIGAWTLAANAIATTLVYSSLDDLVREAEAVVVGTVKSVDARRGPDGVIHTFVTLDQLVMLKGADATGTLMLRFEGGRIGADTLELAGSPRFANAERVLLFVRGNGRAVVPIVGWTQGVFRFVPDERGQLTVVDHDGNRVLRVERSRVLKEGRDERMGPAMSPAAFVEAVREALGSVEGSDKR